MNNATAKYDDKDQDWENETTTYWYCLNGQDSETGVKFDDERFGVVDRCGGETIVDCSGLPLA